MIFSGLGSIPLMQPDEGRNAEVAREMAVSGSWLVPTLEGHPYLDKPAAYFAAVALSLRAFGVNAWGARVPSAMCGLAILILVFAFARKRYDPVTAGWIVIVVATSPMVFAFSRIVIMDIALALCTVAAILASFVAEEGDAPDRRWHAAGAGAAGLGMLVKGPVGALVPAFVLAAYFWVDGRPRALRRVFAPWNVVIVLGLFLPWFAALVHAHPEFLRYGLVNETLNRFFTPTFNRGEPFWYFGPVFVLTLFPWSVALVPMAFAAAATRARWTRVDRLFVVWTIVVLVFFSMSRTKQPGYILTGVVAAAVLVGRGFGLASQNPGGRAARLVARAALAFAAIALMLAAALAFAVGHGSADPSHLAAMAPGERALWMMWLAVLLVFLTAAAIGIAAFVRRSVVTSLAAFAVLPLAIVTVLHPGVEGLARARSAEHLAAEVSALSDGTDIACLGGYPAGLSFYLGRTLTIISADASPLRSNFIIYWLRQVPVRPPNVVNPAERDAWLASRTSPVYLLAPESSRADLTAWIGARAPVRAVVDDWWGASVPPSTGR
jgi:4-amino-4-deoxy-L-arabinose transferase-like glycosyltransferase